MTTELLLHGKAQYGSPPCTNYFRSAKFCNKNIIYLCYKNYLRRSAVLNYSYKLKMTFIPIFIAILARELLLKGKAQYGSPPDTRSARSDQLDYLSFIAKYYLLLIQNRLP